MYFFISRLCNTAFDGGSQRLKISQWPRHVIGLRVQFRCLPGRQDQDQRQPGKGVVRQEDPRDQEDAEREREIAAGNGSRVPEPGVIVQGTPSPTAANSARLT